MRTSLACLLLYSPAVTAACLTDSRGEVWCGAGRCIADIRGTIWCSRHYEGGAEITLDGRTLCGKGDCAKDSHGQVFCASEIGGAVTTDSRGRVRCYGSCEPGNIDDCEQTRADGAGG